MTLEDNIPYNIEIEHPHITDEGRIKEEGKTYALKEFERREKEEGIASSMNFYKRLQPEAREMIDKKYKFELMNRRTCRYCSQFMK